MMENMTIVQDIFLRVENYVITYKCFPEALAMN